MKETRDPREVKNIPCVITFSKKRLNFICSLINCIKSQTIKDFHHIIHLIDYAETEIQFISTVINKDERFTIQRHENLSQKENFRRLLDHATAGEYDYYIKLDDDDIYAPCFLETIIDRTKAHDVACGQSLLIYNSTSKVHKIAKNNPCYGNNMCFSHRAAKHLLQSEDKPALLYEDGNALKILSEAGYKINVFSLEFPQIIYLRHGGNTDKWQ